MVKKFSKAFLREELADRVAGKVTSFLFCPVVPVAETQKNSEKQDSFKLMLNDFCSMYQRSILPFFCNKLSILSDQVKIHDFMSACGSSRPWNLGMESVSQLSEAPGYQSLVTLFLLLFFK